MHGVAVNRSLIELRFDVIDQDPAGGSYLHAAAAAMAAEARSAVNTRAS